ncbi:MAG: type II secretion system F family protein [Acidobacteriia bacterium]|nr:type II secretion system F family protein [Terriglobia bacterium]
MADGDGRIFAVVETAHSHEEVRQKLHGRGLFVYSVKPRGGLAAAIVGQPRQRLVGGSDFLVFNQQFNTLIKAGLPILRALDLLAERAASPKLRPVVGQMRDLVRNGKSLSEAVTETGVFSKVYSTAVLAGEKSGNLPAVLEQFIAYQRVSTGIRKRILATLVYPAILITVAAFIVTYLVTYVVPQFAKLYADMHVELPATTQILLTVTVEYRPFFLASLALLLAGAAGLLMWSRSVRGGELVDRAKFRLPVIGETLLKFQVAQFSRTLATLLGGGTPLVAALATAADAIGSKLLRGTVQKATQRVREGESLHEALGAGGRMPELALDMIEVGESSGALSPMLQSVAELYEEEVAVRLTALVAFIEPAILIFMAVFVLFILAALYLPMFSLSMAGGVK